MTNGPRERELSNWWLCVWASLLGIVLLSGCAQNIAQRQLEAQRQFDQQLGNSYDRYLQADVDSARQILQETARLLENDKTVTEYYRVSNLGLVYSRLCTMENRLSNSASADAALLKVRYFVLRRNELEGRSVPEVMNAVSLITTENIKEMVTRTDKNATGGKGAKYFAK